MAPIAEIRTPHESVNDEYLSLVKVHVANGQPVVPSTLLAELETSKAILELFCDHTGFVQVRCEEGTEVKVGDVLFEVYAEAFVPVVDKSIVAQNADVAAVSSDKVISSPLAVVGDQQFSKDALQLIGKNNIDLSKLSHLSFITTKDIERINGQDKNKGIKKNIDQTQVIKSNSSAITSKKLSPSKKREAEYLQSVNGHGVVSMLSTSIKLSSIDSLLNSQSFISSTPLPTIIFEVSRLLKKYPNLNSYYDDGQQNIYAAINIGFAVDAGKGLKVAAIDDTDGLSIERIEDQISELTQKYLDDKLSKEELTSSTFTITDLFNTDTVDFYPLVNINNSAILGISSLQGDSFKLNLSFDHRVSSGKEVSLFLSDLKIRLEAHFQDRSNKAASKKNIFCMNCSRDPDWDASVYFVQAVNSKEDGYICSNCLSGL